MAFESWRSTTPAQRQEALPRIADAIEARADERVPAITVWPCITWVSVEIISSQSAVTAPVCLTEGKATASQGSRRTKPRAIRLHGEHFGHAARAW